MIDLVAFIKSCAVPYDHVRHNCLITALDACHNSPAAERLREWWHGLDAARRERLSTGAEQVDLDALFTSHGFAPASAPTGYEVGAIKQLADAPPIFVVGANGVWFARGKGRAVKVPKHIPVAHVWRA